MPRVRKLQHALGCSACVLAAAVSMKPVRAESSQPAVPSSGIDLEFVDSSVRPQDDFYRHMNGKWLESFEIPSDKSAYGAFNLIDDETQQQLRSIVEGLAQNTADPDAGKLADLYASFMDEARLESLRLKPLQQTFAQIDALKSRKDIPALIAKFNRTGIGAPLDFGVDQDAKDSTRYAVIVVQSGLGMPDRDYYLKDDAALKEARGKYLAHIEKMLRMAGQPDAHASAAAILKLETALADRQWTRVENRDPLKTYNRIAVADLPKLMPGYDWRAFLVGADLAGKTDYLIVRQPTYLSGLNTLLKDTPLPVWRSYFKWHALATAAPYLSKDFVDERFAFTGTVLSGIPQIRPRWKRGVALLDGSLGEALGKLYVEKYFPPESKSRMQALVHNLLETYARDIDTLDWMSETTRKGAQEKLAKLTTKIGYPDKWRDYSALKIDRGDLWGNVIRATRFESQRDIDKLGKPVDRTEWGMTPQTVNAYYNPGMNEIVFPAAILQPPFFDLQADDAVNYGGIGAVIGHEVSHGFDDRGSQYDADGNLRDWFAPEDHAKFAAKTQTLVAQYDAYEPVPGFHVNGKLTLGENIADNSGLSIAFKAYHLALEGRTAPVIDGFTGDQRLYLGWAQVWRGKVREAEAMQRVKTDPHSPPAVRGTAPLLNQPGFYEAFDIKPGDKMYRPPSDRVSIW